LSATGSNQFPNLAYASVQPFIHVVLPATLFLSSDATSSRDMTPRLRSATGKVDGERRQFCDRAHLDAAPVRPHDLIDNVQAEADAMVARIRSQDAALEGIEHRSKKPA
jgi:hypothetical protein